MAGAWWGRATEDETQDSLTVEAKVGSLHFLSWPMGTLERSVGSRDLVKPDLEKCQRATQGKPEWGDRRQGSKSALVFRYPAWVAGVGDGLPSHFLPRIPAHSQSH